MSKNFYITTPIYYVNDAPHIGHAYTTVLADVLTRYHRLLGYDCFFLTGTDEHGQKVQQAAAKRGITPQEHVDEYNQRFKALWVEMNISHDHFIRTTDKEHMALVQAKLQGLFDKGEIYTKEYEGWYSVGEERFFGEDELVDGKDPISGRPVEWISEKNYFFKMGKYQQQLIDYIENNPDFIQPDFRKNEVLGFLRQDLNDLCISRPASRLSWGIPLPFDTDYVTYVWFDALLNYVSGVQGRTHADGSPMWPATYHLIGKDILTTHCVYWTTMLMAMEIPLPQHILAHGWWLNAGAKMSKSGGTAINPMPYMKEFGVDTFRFFLIRDMVIGQDASFSDDNFFKRINSDLANDLGNGLNRIHKQIEKHFENTIPAADPQLCGEEETILETIGKQLTEKVFVQVPELKLSQTMEDIFGLIREVNRYLEKKAPWKLAKDPEKRPELANVLYYGAEALRLSLSLLYPVMPEKAAQGLTMLGCAVPTIDDLVWGKLEAETKLGAGSALFPRIQIEDKSKEEQGKKNAAVQKPKNKGQNNQDVPPLAKLELRVAQIIEVADHPDADSLYVLKVSTGSETRTICSGLKNHYQPEDLQNRKIVLLANLKTARIRGIESHGMLLAADGPEGAVVLLEPDAELSAGTLLEFANTPAQPKSQLKSKDLSKVKLTIEQGTLHGDGLQAGADGKVVFCEVPDGSEVH